MKNINPTHSGKEAWPKPEWPPMLQSQIRHTECGDVLICAARRSNIFQVFHHAWPTEKRYDVAVSPQSEQIGAELHRLSRGPASWIFATFASMLASLRFAQIRQGALLF